MEPGADELMSRPRQTSCGAGKCVSKRQNAAAIILVLAFLVLLSALIIGFYSSVQTDLSSSKTFEESTFAKQLFATAANIVIGQISDGTKSVKTPQPPGSAGAIAPGERLDWASQPGMIRTWDDNGAGWKLFKLYSARDMVANFNADGSYSASAALPSEIPSDWPAHPGMYVDLNEPVLVEDPQGQIVRNGRASRASYPIVDPLAQSQIDGFSIGAPPGYGGPTTAGSPQISESYDPTMSADPTKTGNPAPMPVAWIYVLKDGTLTAPTAMSADGLTTQWTGSDAAVTPSRANPIVGRIAFWTDDETCKLNVNTASEPTPWDTPRAISQHDVAYGQYQPANGEFQRYPGHPLTTALSPVLFPPNTVLTPAEKDLIYNLIPRVQAGGSKGGTASVRSVNQGITPDQDRLFANVDEFLFEVPARAAARRTAAPSDGAYSTLKLDETRLRRSRFFLTANSRAPEITLYGTPRLCLWPENSNVAQRTAYDQLAAFCTTLGGQPYYFQRAASTSSTADWSGIPRNQSLYKYLQAETGANIPGFGGNFLSSWAADRDQVLTEMFDYIRCTNLNDPQTGAVPFTPNGQVNPITILPAAGGQPTQGFGRMHTISQFGFHFICTEDGKQGLQQDASGKPSQLPDGERRVQASFLFEPFSVALGYFELHENVSYQISFQSKFSIDGQDLQLPSGAVTLSSNNQFANTFHGRNWAGAAGLRGPIQAFGGGSYPLVGKRVQISAANGKKNMSFSGGSVQVKVFSGGASASPVQTFNVTFPPATIPIPDLVTVGTMAQRGAGTTTPNYWWDFATRYSATSQCPHQPGAEYPDAKRRFSFDINNNPPGFKTGGIFRAEDVVRCIVPNHGDLRLVAAQPNPTQNITWSPVGGWADQTQHFYHIFSDPVGTHAFYGFANEPAGALGFSTSLAGDQLTPALYHYARLPEIDAGAGKKYNQWNDFDNGVAHLIDGAYINKPDEGNVAGGSTAGTTNYSYFAWNYVNPTRVFFSPNRLVPSAGMFGSLPTGVKRNQPWQTLLFRPEVKLGGAKTAHPGRGAPLSGPPFITPPDHLAMDLFWMPVIEPYAISEPFSTAGKINMNYEITPFTYIRRATGMLGVMKSEEPLVIPNALSRVYKLWDHETSDWPWLPNDTDARACQDSQVAKDWNSAITGTGAGQTMRLPIDPVQTLSQCDGKFAKGEIYRCATQICEMHLVRKGELLSNYLDGSEWTGAYVTGDNTKERPYTNLYARLTTRSNTFTVHVRAQTLKQAGGSNAADWSVWREQRDRIASEQRGSSIVERYIDPSDPNLPDFASNPNAVADTAYRFRTVSTRKFAP